MLDQFLPVYWWMARASRLHGPHTQAEVDAMDVSVVAALLGVRSETPDDPFGRLSGDFASDSAALIRRRIEAAARAERAAAAPEGDESTT